MSATKLVSPCLSSIALMSQNAQMDAQTSQGPARQQGNLLDPASRNRFRSSVLIRLLTPSVDHQRRRAGEGSYVYDPIATVIPERLRDKLKPTCTPRSCRTTPLAFCS